MPIDPATGQWTPEEVIKQRYTRANQYWDTPRATNPFGALAEGLGGFFSSKESGAADDLVRQNQTITADTMKNAAGAKTTADMSRILAGSGNPQLGMQGLHLQAGNLQRQEEQNTPMARLNLAKTQLAMQQMRRELEQAKLTDPLKVRQLQAQINELEGKGGITGLISKIVRGEDPDAAPAQAPTVPPAAKPMSNEVPSAADPNLIRVQATTTPQAPAKAPEQGIADILRSRSRAEREAWAIMLHKEPKRAMELLQQWVEPKLNKTTEHDLDKNLMGAINSTVRLSQVQEKFKPEYLQATSQANLNLTRLRDKFLNGKLKPSAQELQSLKDYAAWRASAWEELNSYIKDLAGSAVTGNELERTLKARPNPGTGLLDGDSPQEYAAKMDATLRNGKMAIARYRYLRERGLLAPNESMTKRDDLGSKYPLEGMLKIVESEGQATLDRLRQANPTARDDQLRAQAIEEMRKRFGISI